MSSNPLYASYVIHLIAEAEHTDNDYARIAIYDEILDALQDTPAIYGCVLADAVLPVEDYLRLRPERYEQIALFAQQGRLEFGPWFVEGGNTSVEMTIRNLQMGVSTLELLRAPVVTAALPPDAHAQMPQILRGFGIEASITPTGRAAEIFSGADGSTINVFAAPYLDEIDWEQSRATTPGRHLMARVRGRPHDWLRALDSISSKADEPFLSSRASMVNVMDLQGMPVIPKTGVVPGTPAGNLLLHQVEPAMVWAAYEGSAPLKSPQRIAQTVWRDYLRSQPERAAVDVARLLELYPDDGVISNMFSVESDGFAVCAVKLRDDGQPGIILRGINPTGDAHPVTLRAWRHFSRCAVVRLDETRTGAGLPIADGKVQFTSNPHRITTLWLHDG